ncbi:ABC transporter substrate-binding protein [Roseisalinus antarcticus]|uniref:Bacterial extracellular solute-binding protein n=1 Tax=Roseisalinus antarcticus TaxID=254357 RepID=A0A1Y5RYI2_9RHOB|nr:extracellular solute-binding protein [Roseisalinus antarcticus]SLN28549.1 Bacterial extracellular solute-binding protein [Roseisalinus antarcticus]
MKLRAILAGATVLGGLAGAATAQTELSLWYHGGGNQVESDILNTIIEDFNASQSDWEVTLESFPQESYNDSVIAAALAGNLPDIIDVDGLVMPNWAWSGDMQPLQIDESIIEDFLPGPKGYWDGELYSIGLWDAATAMVTRRSYLEDNDIRIPTLEEPWTGDEFMAALDKLKATGDFKYPFDPGMAWTGEWYPYAFSPFLQSFGGDLVDRSTYQTAEGFLNGDETIAFGEWWQSLFAEDYAPGTSQDPADRDNGFTEGKYAISFNGNWAALGALQVFDDTIFLPNVDFGHGPKIGAASWQFGISAASEHPDGASAFIEFALQDKYLTAFSDGIGLIPPTESSAAASVNYTDGGPMEAFYGLSEAQALVRPVTPGYVVEAKVFEKALADIANGADVADTLDAAVDEINADIERNQGYGHQ